MDFLSRLFDSIGIPINPGQTNDIPTPKEIIKSPSIDSSGPPVPVLPLKQVLGTPQIGRGPAAGPAPVTFQIPGVNTPKLMDRGRPSSLPNISQLMGPPTLAAKNKSGGDQGFDLAQMAKIFTSLLGA